MIWSVALGILAGYVLIKVFDKCSPIVWQYVKHLYKKILNSKIWHMHFNATAEILLGVVVFFIILFVIGGILSLFGIK